MAATFPAWEPLRDPVHAQNASDAAPEAPGASPIPQTLLSSQNAS